MLCARRRLIDIFLPIVLAFGAASCWAQAAPPPNKSAKDDPTRLQAFDLYNQGKFVDAMPLFEALAASAPSDPAVREAWAWCMFQYATTLPDVEKRKRVRARARAIAAQAKDLGDTSQLLQLMLDQPEDGGSDTVFSNRQEVDEAMRIAEADFARGDMDKAREGYLRVLLLDPGNYEAALFIGDVYFKQHVYGSAGEWFSRAIQIQPNRETAYRYWGDTLVAMGKEEDARAKFIEGVIAEPYSRDPWIGLTNWLRHNQLELNRVRLKDAAAVTQGDEKNITITIDNNSFKKTNDANGLAWTTYGLNRALWKGDKFKKEFPSETNYRHTLKEEADSLRIMIVVLKEQKDYQKKLQELDPSLQSLIKIQEAGLLEAFVLLNRADDGIAQDYDAYRTAHRDMIRRYLNEFMVPKAPSADKELPR